MGDPGLRALFFCSIDCYEKCTLHSKRDKILSFLSLQKNNDNNLVMVEEAFEMVSVLLNY